MGTNHLKTCKQLEFNLISTYDPKNNDNYFEYLESLINADAVIVSSPTKYHLKTIVDIKNINSNIKILCEKPLSDSSKDPLIKDIIEYSDSILIGQVERFNPVYRKIIDIVDPTEIIQIKTMRVSNSPSREPIDCRKDIGIHDLDLCCCLMGRMPDNISICSDTGCSHEILSYRISDTIISNEISWKYPLKRRRHYILTKNYILYDIDLWSQQLHIYSNNVSNAIDIQFKNPLEIELLHLQDMVRDEISPISTVDNNIALLHLLGY